MHVTLYRLLRILPKELGVMAQIQADHVSNITCSIIYTFLSHIKPSTIFVFRLIYLFIVCLIATELLL